MLGFGQKGSSNTVRTGWQGGKCSRHGSGQFAPSVGPVPTDRPAKMAVGKHQVRFDQQWAEGEEQLALLCSTPALSLTLTHSQIIFHSCREIKHVLCCLVSVVSRQYLIRARLLFALTYIVKELSHRYVR